MVNRHERERERETVPVSACQSRWAKHMLTMWLRLFFMSSGLQQSMDTYEYFSRTETQRYIHMDFDTHTSTRAHIHRFAH